MGKGGKALKNFIESIPDDKINGFTDGEHALYSNTHYRLDNRGLASGDPKIHNLQVRVNRETTISTLKREAGKTVATALVPKAGDWTPDMIRDELLSNRKI
ncbi:hypothetical protein NW754_004018 [Fusarium falciforme]|uniref:Uncharacterized protein n=1 Tax=Fusarium falciforme TaxID=195108 RepID=A0A9W8R8G1_9HYPO|nr:hypothetical protein NW754_004018 [Fusarium falciforme]KAJ4188423.1 hypothetical protein NW755_006584 [Fusarium falciforme]KAJ4258372.1 hypothetical protein NW757_002939 [Fusarium falciforme]